MVLSAVKLTSVDIFFETRNLFFRNKLPINSISNLSLSLNSMIDVKI